jgi:DNA-directed RNA polymerase specialized sigma24 family protein
VSDQDETAEASESDQKEMLARGDLTPFIEMFDAHAAHLFDYCNSLIGDQEEAASATQATLIAAQSLLQDRERLRAWLFALARHECTRLSPDQANASGAEPSDMPKQPAARGPVDASRRKRDLALQTGVYDADIEVLPAGTSADGSHAPAEPLPPPSTLPQRQREALDLVYRHGLRPDDLATVLGVRPEEAQALLQAAEADFGQSADAAPGSAVVQAEETTTSGAGQISALPLAMLPPSIWRDTTAALFGIELPRSNGDGSRTARRLSVRSGRQPGPSAKGRKRLTIGAAALIPLAAGAAGLLYFTHPSGAASSPGGDRVSATTPADPANSPAAAASSRNAAEHGPARHKSAAFPARPAPGTHASSSTRKPKPKPKPKPSRSASPKHTTSGSPAPTTSLGSPPSPSSPSPSPSSPSPSSPSPSAS